MVGPPDESDRLPSCENESRAANAEAPGEGKVDNTPVANESQQAPRSLNYREFQWLLKQGIPTMAILRPEPPKVVVDIDGYSWLAFPHIQECIFWQPRSGELDSLSGHAFALGQDQIATAGILGAPLRIFANPFRWLRAGRKGLVIVDWSQCFDKLRDVQTAVEVCPEIQSKYQKSMAPRVPSLIVGVA